MGPFQRRLNAYRSSEGVIAKRAEDRGGVASFHDEERSERGRSRKRVRARQTNTNKGPCLTSVAFKNTHNNKGGKKNTLNAGAKNKDGTRTGSVHDQGKEWTNFFQKILYSF